MTAAMRFGSVCSGIEAASVAWLPLGWQCQFMSEIEAFPRAVLQHHYPEVPLHGDFTTIQAGQYGPIDILVGGTPCQSFSVAGLRGGMEDARGNLALEYLRLADRLRPRWLVWENVPGVRSSNAGRDFGAFLGGLGELGYGWAYRSLDAQFFGLAQRRERVFVVGCLGDWRRAAAVLFEPESLRGDSSPGRKAGENPAPTLGCGPVSGGRTYGTDADSCDSLIASIDFQNQGSGGNRCWASAYEPIITLNTNERCNIGIAYGGNNCAGPIKVATAFHQNQRAEVTTNDTAGSLNSGGGKPGQGYPAAMVGSAVRRLTPRECCRLQGFPDTYLDITYRGKPAADGPKYKALGNSFAVPVVKWIGARLAAVDVEFKAKVSHAV